MATRRLTLDLTDATRNRLILLREKTDAPSLTEVVRKAIAVYAAITEEGVKVVKRNPDGTERELVIL